MGKINLPVSTAEPVQSGEAPEPTVDANPIDRDLEGVIKNVRNSEDELSLTNEALRLLEVRRMFGLKESDYGNSKEIKDILSWAKRTGVKNNNMLKARLKEIEYKIGHESEPSERLKRVHRYIRLDDQIKNLVNQQVTEYGN